MKESRKILLAGGVLLILIVAFVLLGGALDGKPSDKEESNSTTDSKTISTSELVSKSQSRKKGTEDGKIQDNEAEIVNPPLEVPSSSVVEEPINGNRVRDEEIVPNIVRRNSDDTSKPVPFKNDDIFSTPALAPGNENTAYKLAILNILAALPINTEIRDRIVDADGVLLDVTVKDVLDSLHSKISSPSFDVNSYSWGDRSVNYILNLGLDRMGSKEEKLHHLSDYLILLVVRNELTNDRFFEIVEESIPRYLRHNEIRNDISSLKMRINGGGFFGSFMTREVSVSRYAELIFLTFIGE